MNARLILEALQGVEEVGYVSPTADPPDILGVLMNNTGGRTLGEKLDLMKSKFEITHLDVNDLLNISESLGPLKETPKQRRDRLVDHFAYRLETEEVR